jgi:CVNH domain
MNMKHAILVSLSLSAISFPIYTQPVSAESSSFQESCRNMLVVYKNRLEADCRAPNGNYIHSQLLLRGIHNTNGSLQFSSYNEESSFQFSCSPNTLIPRPSPVLYQYCRASNGQWVSTSITLFDIHNTNGILTYGY